VFKAFIGKAVFFFKRKKKKKGQRKRKKKKLPEKEILIAAWPTLALSTEV